MHLKRPARYVLAGVVAVLAVIVAVAFDSPTSVWVLLAITLVAVVIAVAGSGATR